MVLSDSHNDMKVDMERILEQLLMPPPPSTAKSQNVMNSVESLKDGSSSSLDKSNTSSSTVSSWLSDSSCSCHSVSPQSRSTKSSILFHSRPILPPLLCATSRTEMRVYRTKAVEREQKKKQRDKERLISRVEAILSSVDITPYRKSKAKEMAEGTGKDSSEKLSSVTEQESEKSCSNSTVEGATGNVSVNQLNSNFSADEKDDVASFHDNAYRSSLRNLLRKSTNLSKSKPVSLDRTEIIKDSEKSLSTSQSDSESEDDVTENTVVILKGKSAENKSNKDAESSETEQNSFTSIRDSEDVNEEAEEEVVDLIVESVLQDAKDELLKQNNDREPLFNHNTSDNPELESESNFIPIAEEKTSDFESQLKNITIRGRGENFEDTSVWATPKILNKIEDHETISLDVTNPQFFELHNQSTSTKVDAVICDEEPPAKNEKEYSPIPGDDSAKNDTMFDEDVVELTGAICFESTVVEVSAADTITQPKTCESQTESLSEDLTVLHPASSTISGITMTTATPETEDIVAAYKKELEKEENSSKDEGDITLCNSNVELDTGSLISIRRSSSFTLDRPSKSFESAVVEAVSQHFHGISNAFNGDVNKDDKKATRDSEIAAAKKKRMLHARVRRGSYTLDEPSPYLVKSKEDHIIATETLEDDVCSETIEESGKEVKRKLDLPSDSEESSITMTEKKIKPTLSILKGPSEENSPALKEEEKVVNLCRLLQNQHKNQMEVMKRKHQEQLESLKQELMQEQTKITLVPNGVRNQRTMPPLEITISPSVASTEYHDIKVRNNRYYEEPTPQDATTHDLSRIENTEEVTAVVHRAMNKFSALCRGHLTRQLLRSNKVQDILQIIRDTSRLILSLRVEDAPESIRDIALEDRLLNQLRSALYSLHDIFFNISMGERMYIIAQSLASERMAIEKKLVKTHKLSAATKKSLERKRLLSNNTDSSLRAPVSPPKEVKSKISHIWKTEAAKVPEKKPLTDANRPNIVPQNKKTSKNQKAKSPSLTAAPQGKKAPPVNSRVTSQKAQPRQRVTSQMGKMKSPPTKCSSPNQKVTMRRKVADGRNKAFPPPLKKVNARPVAIV